MNEPHRIFPHHRQRLRDRGKNSILRSNRIYGASVSMSAPYKTFLYYRHDRAMEKESVLRSNRIHTFAGMDRFLNDR